MQFFTRGAFVLTFDAFFTTVYPSSRTSPTLILEISFHMDTLLGNAAWFSRWICSSTGFHVLRNLEKKNADCSPEVSDCSCTVLPINQLDGDIRLLILLLEAMQNVAVDPIWCES
jgi:hypothetical protein